MTRILDYLTGFTAKFYLGVIVTLLTCLPVAYLKGRSDGTALNEAKHARAAAQAVAQARKADAVALDTAQAGKDASGAEIERGRDAAKDSADPWDSAVKAMKGARP